MGITSVTRNYQITIPKDIRETRGIKIGDKIVFSIEGNKIEIFKLRKEVTKDVFGSWKGNIKGPSTAYVKNLRKEWRSRSRRLGI